MLFDLNKYKERFTQKTSTLALVNNLLKEAEPTTTDMIAILERLIELDQHNSKVFEPSLTAITIKTNIDIIFEQAGSPIEKIFTNCLNLLAFRGKKLFIQFHSPITKYREISSMIEEREEIVQRWLTLKGNYSIAPLRFFMEYLENTTSPSYIKSAIISLLTYYIDKIYGLYFVALQTSFNDITVDGKRIRPDMFIFSPYNPDFKLIVECDGYDYHADKRKFSDDRKRDRELLYRGFKVLRFSGTEINNRTVQVTQELYNYLSAQRITQQNQAPNQIEVPLLSK